MPIAEGYKRNFETLKRVFKNEDVALMECSDAVTGKPVIVICAVLQREDGFFHFVPFAKMFDGDPYEELNPPEINDELETPSTNEQV